MSAGIVVFCTQCKAKIHLGQSSGAGASFGYGRNDFTGQKLAAEFVAKHVYCDLEHGIGCTLSDHAPDDYEEVDYWPGRGSEVKSRMDRIMADVADALFATDALSAEEKEEVPAEMERYAVLLDEWGRWNLNEELLAMNSGIVLMAREIAEFIRAKGQPHHDR